MSNYQATIQWHRGSDVFTDNRYSRRHEMVFDGGAVWAGSSSPQVVPLPMSDASAVDPEESFVASLSSCHMLWFLDIARRAGWLVNRYRDQAVGVMARNAQGQTAMTLVTLNPEVEFGGHTQPDVVELMRLHHQAHADCFIANSVKTEVRCVPVLPSTSQASQSTQ
jgi:organic hydroperoxide reductase OsmC/OhrA